MMASGTSRGLLAACAIIVHIGCNEAQVSLPFQCSFESDDLCNMPQRTDDQFDWTRHTGSTQSLDTGPSEALDGDYYIYIEASPHANGEKAYIETPRLGHDGAICVQFWYHMYTNYPAVMGRLVVFTDSQGEGNPLFDVGGVNKGDQWILKQITVTGFQYGDKIVFLNEERSGYYGDMALDMLDIQAGTCNVPVSLPFQCSFESDDLCGMPQRTDDQFDWTRHTGPTPSRPEGTGPYNAMDGDYYIYIEASDHTNWERAIIETPRLRFSGAICVQFWYHMYTLNPPHMGRLVVFAESQGEGNPLFDVGGVNKGDQWILEQITVTRFQYHDKIVFLNEERNAHQGDMALDMIDIQDGVCDACSLKNGGCDTRCVPDGKGRRCECDVGYHLDGDGVRCFDIDECIANGGKGDCGHQCYNTPGSYRCDCDSGYTLNGDQKSCDDMNECAPNGGKGDCDHQCYNTPGSYQCDCDSGYTLNGDQKSCDDIDECATNGGKGDCSHQCDNTPGLYWCDCDSGYTLNDDQKSCDDIDECAPNGLKGDCGHQCYNAPGSYRCDCDSGYTLNGDQKSCDDINECSANGGRGPCDVTCENKPGRYMCSCLDDQHLQDDGTTCADCQDVYRKQLDASQAFTSLCPTIETYLNIPLTTCVINACADNVSVVAYASNVCTLKLCIGGDLQLERAPGSSGWDIYVLNTTWTGSRPEDASSFPLWQLLTGVFVGAAALGAIIAVVTVCVRKRRHKTTVENTRETQPEGGVYENVFPRDVLKPRGPNGV